MNMQISLHIIKPRHDPFGDTSLDQSLPKQKIVPTTSKVMSMIRHAVFNCWTMMAPLSYLDEPALCVASSRPSKGKNATKTIWVCREDVLYGDLEDVLCPLATACMAARGSMDNITVHADLPSPPPSALQLVIRNRTHADKIAGLLLILRSP